MCSFQLQINERHVGDFDIGPSKLLADTNGLLVMEHCLRRYQQLTPFLHNLTFIPGFFLKPCESSLASLTLLVPHGIAKPEPQAWIRITAKSGGVRQQYDNITTLLPLIMHKFKYKRAYFSVEDHLGISQTPYTSCHWVKVCLKVVIPARSTGR